MARPIYVLIEEKLLAAFDKSRKKMGLNRSEAIREAMKQFAAKGAVAKKPAKKRKRRK